jgi:preprotein translocase subunit SecB
MTMEITSRLSLDDCRIERLQILQNRDESDTSAVEPEIKFDYDVRRRTGSWTFDVKLDLRARIPKPASGHVTEVAIVLHGVFSMPADAEEEEVRRYVPVLCVANLYSTARGFIAGCTGLFHGGVIILPVLNIVEAIKQRTLKEQSKPRSVSSVPKRKSKPRK